MTWGAAQLGIGQGVLDAVADGLLEATDDILVLVAVWVDAAADGRDGCSGSEPRGDAQGDRRVRRGTRPGGGGRARRAPRLAPESVLLRRVKIASIETSRYRYPLRAAVPRCVGPGAADVPGSDGRGRPLGRRIEGYASGDALPDRELLERLLLGLDPPTRRRSTGSSRRSTSTTGATGSSRSRSGISSDARKNEPSGASSAGSATGPRVRVERRARRRGRARPACAALRDAGVTGREDPAPLAGLA